MIFCMKLSHYSEIRHDHTCQIKSVSASTSTVLSHSWVSSPAGPTFLGRGCFSELFCPRYVCEGTDGMCLGPVVRVRFSLRVASSQTEHVRPVPRQAMSRGSPEGRVGAGVLPPPSALPGSSLVPTVGPGSHLSWCMLALMFIVL